MIASKNKGRFAFDLLLTLEDISREKTFLSEFYLQLKDVICNFLNVENFYIALLNDEMITYPLAVKNQKVVKWNKRNLEDRLTDRVILEGESIFFSKQAEEAVILAGFEPSIESLGAWMGVPLIVQQSVVGCLSVFTHVPGFVFDEMDEILFSLVAAKLSSRLEISQLMQENIVYQEKLYSKEHMETVLNSVSEGVLFIDLFGNIVLFNEAFSKLANPSSFIEEGTVFYEFHDYIYEIISCQVDDIEIWLEQAKNQKAIHDKTPFYKLGDRHYQRELVSVNDTRDIVGILFVINDMTDEVSLQETRDLISSTIVHDLRSPMSSVISGLLLINEVLPEDYKNDIYTQAFDIAQRNVQRVINLVESLLDISKLESGEMKLYREDFDLREVVDEMMLEQKIRADYLKVNLLTKHSSANLFLYADRNMIQRVVQNLIDNALKYSSAGDSVVLSISESEDGKIFLSVSDEGPGVPKDQENRIFERFVQASGDKKTGTGLGLTFCRLAVEAHNGTIYVKPNKNKGSVFVVELPLGR